MLFLPNKFLGKTYAKNHCKSVFYKQKIKLSKEINRRFLQKLNLKCKTTKNNIISSYKEDYFFDRKIREDRVLDDLDRLFQN